MSNFKNQKKISGLLELAGNKSAEHRNSPAFGKEVSPASRKSSNEVLIFGNQKLKISPAKPSLVKEIDIPSDK